MGGGGAKGEGAPAHGAGAQSTPVPSVLFLLLPAPGSAPGPGPASHRPVDGELIVQAADAAGLDEPALRLEVGVERGAGMEGAALAAPVPQAQEPALLHPAVATRPDTLLAVTQGENQPSASAENGRGRC